MIQPIFSLSISGNRMKSAKNCQSITSNKIQKFKDLPDTLPRRLLVLCLFDLGFRRLSLFLTVETETSESVLEESESESELTTLSNSGIKLFLRPILPLARLGDGATNNSSIIFSASTES